MKAFASHTGSASGKSTAVAERLQQGHEAWRESFGAQRGDEEKTRNRCKGCNQFKRQQSWRYPRLGNRRRDVGACVHLDDVGIEVPARNESPLRNTRLGARRLLDGLPTPPPSSRLSAPLAGAPSLSGSAQPNVRLAHRQPTAHRSAPTAMQRQRRSAQPAARRRRPGKEGAKIA